MKIAVWRRSLAATRSGTGAILARHVNCGWQSRSWILAILVQTGLVLITHTPASPQSVPLQAMPVWKTEVVNRYVYVTVRNSAAQTITALEIRATVTYEDGSTEKTGMSTDYALTGHRDTGSSAPRPFNPGSTITIRIPARLRDLRVTSVATVPTMVVFADRTAIGEERTIAYIFESRRKEYDALQQVEKLLVDAIEQSGDAWEAFTVVDRRLDEPGTQTIRDNTAYRQVRQNVTLWMRRDPGDREKAAFRLHYALGDVQTRLARAKEHMQRR